MNDPDTEDRGLEDYLAGGSELSEAYRRLGREEPEGRLDQSILSAARHHVDVEHQVAHSPFSRNWVVPASLAAVLALSVSVVLLMTQPAPELDSEPTRLAPAAGGEPEAAQERSDANRQPRKATTGSTPLLRQPEPKAESFDTSGIALPPANVEGRRKLAPSPGLRMEADGMAAGHAGSATDAPVSEGEEKREMAPEAWLTQIAELRKQGLYAAAEAQLAAFRDRYPDFPAAAFLRALGPAASRAGPGQGTEPLPSGAVP